MWTQFLRAYPLAHGEGGANGALGVILMCDRSAERPHDSVAHDAGDGSTEALDLGAHDVSALRSKSLDVFWVQLLGQ